MSLVRTVAFWACVFLVAVVGLTCLAKLLGLLS